MKSYTIIAIVLVDLGIAAFANQGISFTTTENIINLGSIQLTEENNRLIPLPLIMGGICLVGAIFLLLLGRKKD